MSRDAYAFIQAVRDDAGLRTRLAAVGPDARLDEVIEVAASAGYSFDVDELRAAHRRDWTLRRLLYADMRSSSDRASIR